MCRPFRCDRSATSMHAGVACPSSSELSGMHQAWATDSSSTMCTFQEAAAQMLQGLSDDEVCNASQAIPDIQIFMRRDIR